MCGRYFRPAQAARTRFSVNATMLMMDPPDHTRLRRLVLKAFMSRAVERLRPGIERITDELLDGLERAAADGPMDLVESFAMPLPVRVIGDLLGVPAALRDSFRTAGEPLLSSIHPGEVATASAALATLLRRLIRDKRQDPGRDLLTALIEARDNGDQLSDDELLTTAYLLILAWVRNHGEPHRKRHPGLTAKPVAACRAAPNHPCCPLRWKSFCATRVRSTSPPSDSPLFRSEWAT